MNVADDRFLFDYDGWAMSRILDALERDGPIELVTWSATNGIDRRRAEAAALLTTAAGRLATST